MSLRWIISTQPASSRTTTATLFRCFGYDHLLQGPRSGEQLEAFAVQRPKGMEVPVIQGQDPVRAIPGGQHDQGRVSESDPRVPVALDDVGRGGESPGSDGREFVGGSGKLTEDGELGPSHRRVAQPGSRARRRRTVR